MDYDRFVKDKTDKFVIDNEKKSYWTNICEGIEHYEWDWSMICDLLNELDMDYKELKDDYDDLKKQSEEYNHGRFKLKTVDGETGFFDDGHLIENKDLLYLLRTYKPKLEELEKTVKNRNEQIKGLNRKIKKLEQEKEESWIWSCLNDEIQHNKELKSDSIIAEISYVTLVMLKNRIERKPYKWSWDKVKQL